MLPGRELKDYDYEKLLKESWITREIADRAMLRRVDSKEGAVLVGRNGAGDYAGIAFPYFLPGGDYPREYRLRRDRPDFEQSTAGSSKEKTKYLSPPGRGNLLYFVVPGTTFDDLDNVNLPIVITEGEKKTLALYRLAHHGNVESRRFMPLGLSGVWSWRGRIGKEPGPDGQRSDVKGPIPDLSLIKWSARKIFIVFDSDSKRNPRTQLAIQRLKTELAGRGANVRAVELPDLEGFEKTGADDFLAVQGPDAFLGLLDEAERPLEAKSVTEILRDVGFDTLTQDRRGELDAVLRRLVAKVSEADPLLRISLREEAIKRMKALQVEAPGRYMEAVFALSRNVSNANETFQGRAITLSDPEPWPEVVDGVELLNDICAIFTRFIVLPEGGAEALALFVLHTYTLDAAFFSPILGITSPEKRCGKTRVLEVLGTLVRRPLISSNITPAAFYRVVERFAPTVLIDEADTFLSRHDELRGVLNNSHQKDTAWVTRTVGDEHEPRNFGTWCAKAIALIGDLPATLADRGIVLPMCRKSPSEKVKSLRRDRIRQDLEPLRRKAIRWAKDQLGAVRNCDCDVPECLNDRAQDNWRPLLAIAEIAGGDWPEKARRAASVLSVTEGENSASIQLLADLRDLFRKRKVDRLSSDEIVRELSEMEERPWPEWKNGKAITTRQLARLLKRYRIQPIQLWNEGKNTRGYELKDCVEAFTRYTPHFDPLEPLEPASLLGSKGVFDPLEPTSPSGSKRSLKPASGAGSSGSSGPKGGVEEKYVEGFSGIERRESGEACYSCGSTGQWRRLPDGPWRCVQCHPPI